MEVIMKLTDSDARCAALSAALLALCVFTGCKEKDTAAQSTAAAAGSAEQPVRRTKTRQIALYSDKDGNNTPLYIEDKDGKMVWADEIFAGEYIYAYENPEGNGGLEEKNAVRRQSNGKEEAMDFVHVYDDYTDKDYWTRPIFITHFSDMSRAVVTTDSYIYSSTDLVNAKTTKVTAGTFVARLRSEEIDGIPFEKIYYYDWNTPYGKEGYIKQDAVSTDYAGDVMPAQVAQALLRAKDVKPFVREGVIEAMEALAEDYRNNN